MTEIRCSGVLFDLDGVLIDSTPAGTRVWRQGAWKHGFDPDEVVARVHGRPSLATVREYLPTDQAADNREIERREMQDADGIIALPGARELLLELPAERWTIATSCTRPLAEVRLRAAGLPIPERLVTSTDVTLGKPHPEPFLQAAAKLGFPASECVVVEDVPAGMRAGKAAGARVIAIRTSVEEAELRRAGADFILNDCTDVGGAHNSGGLTLILNGTRWETSELACSRVCRKICSRHLTKFHPPEATRKCVAEIC
jgi:sugar-phosphatase